MASFLHLVLLVLATYSISLQITKLGGPGGIFRKLRSLPKKGSSLEELLSCPICFGQNVSFVLCAVAVFLGWLGWSEWPVYVFAVSGGNALLNLADSV